MDSRKSTVVRARKGVHIRRAQHVVQVHPYRLEKNTYLIECG